MITDVDCELDTFRERYRVPAVGAAVVARDGTLTVSVTGVVHRGSDKVVRPDDRWHIGSCAKSLTAALWARLVEAGRTSWDAPLASCFPDLDVHPGWMQRTVAEALTCTAGIQANPGRRDLKAAYRDDRDVDEQRTVAVRRALAIAPHKPGRFLYSNLGYVVVGAAVDRVAEVPYELALQTHLLEQLGVTTARFGPPPRIWGHAPRLLIGSLAAGRGSPMPPDNVRSDNPPVLTPAGRLHLSLEDWARFHTMIVAGGNEILRPDTIERLLTPPAGGRMSMGWASAMQLDGVGLGMQGSNTMWSAAALMTADRERAALVVVNDGRTRILTASAYLAHRLLRG